MLDASWGELAWLALSVVAAGIVTGLLAGLFGIGGGAVIVPVLFEIFRILGVPDAVRMQLCIGTSLAVIIPTAVRSYRAHQARGLVIPEVVRTWTVPAVLGVVLGSIIAAVAPAERVQGGVCRHRLDHRRPALCRRRPLAGQRGFAEPSRDADLWLRDRASARR